MSYVHMAATAMTALKKTTVSSVVFFASLFPRESVQHFLTALIFFHRRVHLGREKLSEMQRTGRRIPTKNRDGF